MYKRDKHILFFLFLIFIYLIYRFNQSEIFWYYDGLFFSICFYYLWYILFFRDYYIFGLRQIRNNYPVLGLEYKYYHRDNKVSRIYVRYSDSNDWYLLSSSYYKDLNLTKSTVEGYLLRHLCIGDYLNIEIDKDERLNHRLMQILSFLFISVTLLIYWLSLYSVQTNL